MYVFLCICNLTFVYGHPESFEMQIYISDNKERKLYILRSDILHSNMEKKKKEITRDER